MKKEVKTEAKLEALVMEGVGRRPDCTQVRSVVVAGDETGWRVAAVVRHGTGAAMDEIEEIAAELRTK